MNSAAMENLIETLEEFVRLKGGKDAWENELFVAESLLRILRLADGPHIDRAGDKIRAEIYNSGFHSET